VPRFIPPHDAAEELRLWADYYEANTRVLEIIRRKGTTAEALAQILPEDAKASAAIKRIREILGLKP
jgi:hypothetical protein